MKDQGTVSRMLYASQEHNTHRGQVPALRVDLPVDQKESKDEELEGCMAQLAKCLETIKTWAGSSDPMLAWRYEIVIPVMRK